MKQAMQADSEYWLKRPMDENALKYARQDVTFLCTVQRYLFSCYHNYLFHY